MHFEPVSRELQVADDLGMKRPDPVTRRIAAKPREQLLGTRSASDFVPGLEDQYLAA
jgi:hypothetical protein